MSALRAARRGLSRWAAALPVLTAVVLVVAATPLLDDPGWASVVLRGAAVLLALGVAAAVDEADARLLDASPTPFARRVTLRLILVGGAVLPLALLVLWWGTRRNDADAAQLALELGALVVAALTLSASLRRWTSVAEPAVLTGPLLVVAVLAGTQLAPHLPDLGLSATQRWSTLLALAAVACAAALREPATASRRVLV